MLWVYFKLLHDIFQLCKLKYTVDQLYDATFFQRIFKKKSEKIVFNYVLLL